MDASDLQLCCAHWVLEVYFRACELRKVFQVLEAIVPDDPQYCQASGMG